MFDAAKQYKKERKAWVKAGKPIRTAEKMKEIHDICTECPLFRKGKGMLPGYDKCGKCGCNLHPSTKHLNKIAWATTKCPDKPPKWEAEGP